MRLHRYHRGENGSAISGAWSLYLNEGTDARFKGWYSLLPGRRPHGNYAEFEIALGGEDNMLQAGVRLPLLGCCYVGVRVPRKLTEGWVYQRREWTLRLGYIGHWAELLLAYDDDADGMSSYYRGLRERGEHVRYNRLTTWPGIRLKLDPQLRDRIFGRHTRLVEEVVQENVPCVVPMPEGNYAATAKVTREVRGRKRWKPGHKMSCSTWVEVEGGIPFPGKGENSWDCEDDAVYAGGENGASIGAACGKLAASVMRHREQYGFGLSWVPDKGWPEEISRGGARS